MDPIRRLASLLEKHCETISYGRTVTVEEYGEARETGVVGLPATRCGGELGLYSTIFLGAALLVTILVVSSMLRRPVLRRMGLRNVTRRKWNTTLVVVGSMVGTALISGSLVLNDSTGRFQEDEALQTLGEIDEVVQQTGQRVPSDRRPIPLFDASVAEEITPEAIRDSIEATDVERTTTDRMLGALALDEGPASVDGVLAVLTGEIP